MGLDKPTTTAALLRRLAIPAVFVAVVIYTQFNREPPPPPADTLSASALSTDVLTELSGPTMGTTFTVKVRGPELDPPAAQALTQAVTQALEGVNQAMSTWLKASELSQFNDGPAGVPFKFSPPTLAVMAISQEVNQASGGAFDVTVGPLVNRWGFGPDAAQPPPDQGEITALLGQIGQNKLTIDLVSGTVTKATPGLRVDLSAVAKGFAVDQVALALEGLGHRAYMVEVGGEVRAGSRGAGELWRIAVENPTSPLKGQPEQQDIFEVLELEGMSMATSGDYRNFVIHGDTLRSHTIDPRTGSPVTHGLASVTVLHERCALADAWATALLVLGPEAGLTLAENEGLAAMFISREGGALKRRATTGFEPYSKRIKTGQAN